MGREGKGTIFPRLNYQVLTQRAAAIARDPGNIKSIRLHLVSLHLSQKYPYYALVIEPDLASTSGLIDSLASLKLLSQKAARYFISPDVYQIHPPNSQELEKEWLIHLKGKADSESEITVSWEHMMLTLTIDKELMWELYPTTELPKTKIKERVKASSFPMPSNVSWEEISIEFVDGLTVRVTVEEPGYTTAAVSDLCNFAEMGFKDNRSGDANQQWEILRDLIAHSKGRLSWGKYEVNMNNRHKKSQLSKTLKAFFQLEDDPFEPYDHQYGWIARFAISPED